MTRLLWSPQRADRKTAGQLNIAMREQSDNERAMQPEHQRLLPQRWKIMRVEQVQEVAVKRNSPVVRIDGKPKCKEEIIRDPLM